VCSQVTDIGAIVDESQRQSVADYVAKAKAEGNTVFQTCACMPKTGEFCFFVRDQIVFFLPFFSNHTCAGIFYPPTLITDCNTTSTVVQEEIFGPVLVVLKFRTAKEAIAIANQVRSYTFLIGVPSFIHVCSVRRVLVSARVCGLKTSAWRWRRVSV
jgi:acyl-CoA reductase-like NAD-dependent aldehyde dehydrogenase